MKQIQASNSQFTALKSADMIQARMQSKNYRTKVEKREAEISHVCIRSYAHVKPHLPDQKKKKRKERKKERKKDKRKEKAESIKSHLAIH